MERPTKQTLLNLLKSGYSLPPLSPVATKLVELAADDSCSASDLANLIEKDPSLSVRLLKLANSAFFRTLYPVTTLTQAVVKVGFQHLRIMALSVSLRDAFPMGKVGSLDYEKFWRNSIYRALIAKHLAQRLKTCNSEEAFVAALIMEIGLLVFFDLFIKGSPEEIDFNLDPLEDLLKWENERYGSDHRKIGEAVLDYWHFPGHMVLCQHASSDSLTSEDNNPLVRICQLASVLSRIVSSDSEGFNAPYQVAEEFFGLDRNVINNILLTTFDQVDDIAESLRVDMNREKDLLRIVEKANVTLSRISEKITLDQNVQESNTLPSLDSLRDTLDSVSTLQVVAHEIRNPLTVIGGFARRLATSVESDSAGSRYANIILNEVVRVEAFLSEMITKTEQDRE
jgi:two-component system cell cycle response regulator